MLHFSRTIMAVICVLLCVRVTFADDSATVHVKYTNGETEIAAVEAGAKFCSDRDFTFTTFPDELSGTKFTRRPVSHNSPVTITAPSGSDIFLLTGDAGGAARLRDSAVVAGFTKIGSLRLTNGAGFIVYRLAVSEPKHITLNGTGIYGAVVAAKDLALDSGDEPTNNHPGESPPKSTTHADPSQDDSPISGPTTRAAIVQTSIRSLEIQDTSTGLMLGQTSEVVLTATPGTSSRMTKVWFVTPVGDHMLLACEDAMRFVHVTYPNWYVDRAEITFEDKYDNHDGGSIGAAVGTMVLSIIQGFAIDPDIAMTGDVGANGKVHAIGAVAAKLRGAIASKCTIVALPTENYDQLVDAVTYNGTSLVSDVQVIGISNLNDAVATDRTDRDPKLTQAIALFSEIQLGIKNVPGYLKKPEAREKLAQVLELCPRHLSAKLLLDVITGEQPKTLSATATFYYTSLAVGNVSAVLNQRDKWQDPQLVPSAVVRIGLADLRKLMPLADPNVKPLIVAWMRFIEAWNDLQQGEGSGRELETRAQALTDEMTREDTNADLMQKTLKEGF